jgi:hypothetical protein
MIKHKVYMVQNDTGPPIDFDIVNDDAVYDDEGCLVTPATPFDLTGCTVRFSIKSPTGVITNAAHMVCDILDELAGTARYNFSAGDIPKPGKYQCDVEVTNASSIVQTEYTVTEIMVRSEND